MISIGLLCGLLATVEGHAQEESTWWHGAYVNAGSSNCDSNDSLVSFDAETVQPWETYCKITQQVDLRDMQGVLLDIQCGFPDSESEAYNDRIVLLELSSGNLIRYSRLDKNQAELQRCPQ